MSFIKPVLFSFAAASVVGAAVAGVSVGENNMAANPPLIGSSQTSCAVRLSFKPTPAPDQSQHAYLVISTPAGDNVEVRGGPQRGGSASGSGSGDQASGNPFSCSTKHKMGVVVPYIGKHGLLGKNDKGEDVYSPDGNVSAPTASFDIKKSAQKNSCALADCLMTMVQQAGKSCEDYVLATAYMRNSNTIISNALSACGVSDPKPSSLFVPGWGEAWFGPADGE